MLDSYISEGPDLKTGHHPECSLIKRTELESDQDSMIYKKYKEWKNILSYMTEI